MATAQEELEKARSLSRIKYMFPKNTNDINRR